MNDARPRQEKTEGGTHTSIDRRARLDALLAVTKACYGHDPYMPVSTLMTLLEVARKEGRSMTEIGEATGMSLPTLSRQIGLLSDYSSSGKDSFGFVVARNLPKNRRVKVVELTKSGLEFVQTLLDELEARNRGAHEE